MSRGSPSLRLAELLAAIGRDPENLALRVQAGNALIASGDVAQAIEMFRFVVRGHAKSGRHAQARIVAKSVLQHAPGDQELLSAIAGPPAGLPTAPILPTANTLQPYEVDDRTPLPSPLTFHEADPSITSMSFALLDSTLDALNDAADADDLSSVGTDPLLRPRVVTHGGLSAAARAISQRMLPAERESDREVTIPESQPIVSEPRPTTLQDPDDDVDVTFPQTLLTPPP